MLASKELFQKNLAALNDMIYLSLREKLEAVQESKFKIIFGNDSLDINLKDMSKGGGA